MAIKTRKIQLGIVAGWNPEWPDPRGVRVTEKNYLEVKDWVGGNTIARTKVAPGGDVSDHNVKIFTDRGDRVRVARVGDVVYRYKTGHTEWQYSVIKENVFLGFEK